jgi:ATP-dependent Clp protease ATP-binding subunit ClpA
VLFCAAQEADELASKAISTEHLLLGLLREENCFASNFLQEHGVYLARTREELIRNPHTPSAPSGFVRERGPLPNDVVELQDQVRSIFKGVRNAVTQGDFLKAREYSDEEGQAREKLHSLYLRYDLLDWLYE